MQQRRTPGGQRPARRPGQPGRTGGARVRSTARDNGVRAEARAAGRSPGASRATDGVRSASRPAAARRTAAGGPVKRLTAPQPRRFTGRATVLFAVLIALALAYTYPVRVYLDQQADIERMEAAQAAQRAEIDRLTAEAAKWKDPEYVKTQARERFFMGKPGETLLVVLSDPEGAAKDAGKGAKPGAPKPPEPWYDTLWGSVRAANAERPDK
ncbi:septum formation initiator family protein [Micromonospora aurantiaca]|uniref:Septum formation initiator family protein n=2 Tax=Micromonospora TaxID=1873 RepID=A0A6N9YF67_9ACTN|nr:MULTISPECIES: septum formation initiator family protein [Micromonospora]AXH94464.1 septum formation initiator family protein [Micromonospora aurantiaca]AYF29718.1 septation ring formation regulator EzrA [Micromonospora tulbaghiae]MBC9005536.1 septum formation initiator family protein [Micromonospora aurantiaca]MCO1615818.1 septum formation initiator family protein [Micromonospora sp. CPM1]NED59185.1 septum formation initiator family protein [Micromonospora aurantiaca]